MLLKKYDESLFNNQCLSQELLQKIADINAIKRTARRQRKTKTKTPNWKHKRGKRPSAQSLLQFRWRWWSNLR